MVEKYYNDKGEVGVLVSEGYGAGWSTWNDTGEDIEELLFDKGLIELVLKEASEDELEQYVNKRWDKYIYTGGLSDLVVVFLPKGTKFIIEVYDGCESIHLLDEIRWLEA